MDEQRGDKRVVCGHWVRRAFAAEERGVSLGDIIDNGITDTACCARAMRSCLHDWFAAAEERHFLGGGWVDGFVDSS